MSSNYTQKGVYIKVNDIFEDLFEENKRLNNELMFANNCLNVLNKFKTLLSKICVKLEIIIDSEDKQELNQLEEEYSFVLRCKEQLREEKTNREPNDEEIIECFDENPNDLCEDALEIFARSVKKNTERLQRNNETNLFGSELLEYRLRGKTSDESKAIKRKESSFEDNDNNLEESDGKSGQRPIRQVLYRENRFAKYTCRYPECGHPFDRPSRLNEHLKQKHVFEKSYKCEECSEDFYTVLDLREHQLVHSMDSFECEKCHKLFKRKSLLDKHRRTHIKKAPNKEKELTPTKCDICNKMFRNVIRMKAHQIDVHKRERLVCDWPGCGKTFKHKKTLWSHKQTHSGILKYRCDVEGCGKAFAVKCSFNGHKKYHERNFICTWPNCGKGFISEIERSGHLNRHLDVRPFKCSVEDCRNEYYTESSLRGHVLRIHNKHMSELKNN